MTERVSVIRGKNPIILVAPHGGDDPKTAIIAEEAAKEFKGWAVINRGFKRNSTVDVINDKASCHRIDHITQPVVEDEFLIPLNNIINRQVKIFTRGKEFYWLSSIKERILIYYIYSCSDQVHQVTGDDVGVVLGYGRGARKDSLTCTPWRKNLFSKLYEQYENGVVYEGKPGGKFAARGSNNIVQYHRMFSNNPIVESMQLAFPNSYIHSNARALMTGMILGATIQETMKYKEFDGRKPPRLI